MPYVPLSKTICFLQTFTNGQREVVKKRQKSTSGAMLLVYLPRGRDVVCYRDALHQTDPFFVVYQPVHLF